MAAEGLHVVQGVDHLVLVAAGVVHVGVQGRRIVGTGGVGVLLEGILTQGLRSGLLLAAVVSVVVVEIVGEVLQELDLGVPVGDEEGPVVVTHVAVGIPERVVGLGVFLVALRSTVLAIVHRVGGRDHLLGGEGSEEAGAHRADVVVGAVAADAGSDAQPVGDVAVEVDTAVEALVASVTDDTGVVGVTEAHRVAAPLLLAVDGHGVGLLPLIEVDVIPPVDVRIGDIVGIGLVG